MSFDRSKIHFWLFGAWILITGCTRYYIIVGCSLRLVLDQTHSVLLFWHAYTHLHRRMFPLVAATNCRWMFQQICRLRTSWLFKVRKPLSNWYLSFGKQPLLLICRSVAEEEFLVAVFVNRSRKTNFALFCFVLLFLN